MIPAKSRGTQVLLWALIAFCAVLLPVTAQGAVGELAIARLSGLDTGAIATVILLYLAERPLLRSRLLGALVAALCEEREVP